MDGSIVIIDESKCDDWMQVARAFQVCVKQSLVDILHNGLPRNHQEMLENFREEREEEKADLIMFNQWNMIHHKCIDNCSPQCSDEGKSNIRMMSIPNIITLIEHLTAIEPPSNRWHEAVDIHHNDGKNKADYVLMAKGLYKALHKGSASSKSSQTISGYWQLIYDLLQGLGYSNMNVYQYLKEASMDELETEQIEVLHDKCHLLNIRDDDYDHSQKEIQYLATLVKSYSLRDNEIDKMCSDTGHEKI